MISSFFVDFSMIELWKFFLLVIHLVFLCFFRFFFLLLLLLRYIEGQVEANTWWLRFSTNKNIHWVCWRYYIKFQEAKSVSEDPIALMVFKIYAVLLCCPRATWNSMRSMSKCQSVSILLYYLIYDILWEQTWLLAGLWLWLRLFSWNWSIGFEEFVHSNQANIEWLWLLSEWACI